MRNEGRIIDINALQLGYNGQLLNSPDQEGDKYEYCGRTLRRRFVSFSRDASDECRSREEQLSHNGIESAWKSDVVVVRPTLEMSGTISPRGLL